MQSFLKKLLVLWSLVLETSRALDQCVQTDIQRTDCGPTDESSCIGAGCYWCANILPNCIYGKACFQSYREECWDYSTFPGSPNAFTCYSQGCSWCPFGSGPYCVKDKPFCEKSSEEREQCYDRFWNKLHSRGACESEEGCVWCPYPPNPYEDAFCLRSYFPPGFQPVGTTSTSTTTTTTSTTATSTTTPEPTIATTTTTSTTSTTTPEPTTATTTSTSTTTTSTTTRLTSTTTPEPTTVCPPGQMQRYRQGGCCTGSSPSTTQWPWMGAYYIDGVPKCSAALITDSYALSSARCLLAGFNEISVKFGAENLHDFNSSYVQMKSVTGNAITYFEYNQHFKNHDLMILNLDGNISRTNYVQPIDLSQEEMTSVNKTCFALKWNKNSTSDLASIQVKIIPFSNCIVAYAMDEDVVMKSKEMLCAAVDSDGSSGLCGGDEGGPLVCQRCSTCEWYLAGIFSFSNGCDQPGFPGVYVKVAKYEEWMKSTGIVHETGKTYNGTCT